MDHLGSPDAPKHAGTLWLETQQAAKDMRKPLIERLLKNVEGALEVDIDIPKLKRDQMQMYAYFGDPALQLSLPEKLKAEVKKTADGQWTWKAEKPAGATRLVVQLREKTKPVRSKPSGTGREKALELFEQRNKLFAYKTLVELKADQPWNGSVTTPATCVSSPSRKMASK